MFKGPFRIEASEKAELIDVLSLSEAERQALLDGIKMPRPDCEVYRFFVAPAYKAPNDTPYWKQKRVSFELVNRVVIDVKRGSNLINFFGMHPTGMRSDGQWKLDLKGQAGAELAVPGVKGFIKLSAFAKNLSRRKSKPPVDAHRTDGFVQWIFFEKWCREESDFKMQILCEVPKSLPAEGRFLSCSALFMDDGRSLRKLKNRRIIFPASAKTA